MLGIAIFSFNRPNYLKRTLAALSACKLPNEYAVYLFQDGAKNPFSGRITARQTEIESCIDIFKATPLKNKHVIQSKHNLGIAIQQFNARNYMFERHTTTFFLEDDIIINEDYVNITLFLLKQTDAGVAMAHGNCVNDDPTKALYLQSGNTNKLAWAMRSTTWDAMLPHFLPYYSLVERVDYRYRPHEEIRALFKMYGHPRGHTSQDAAFDLALYLANTYPINTVTSRATYIGAYGEHGTPEIYLARGYGKITLKRYPNDETLTYAIKPASFYKAQWEEFIRNGK